MLEDIHIERIMGEDFEKVFTKFEMTNYSNANGTITVNITIDKKYVYTDNKDLEKITEKNLYEYYKELLSKYNIG